MAVRAGSINAGHTVIHEGKQYKLRLVPSTFLYKRCKLFIGPGANVSPPAFLDEVEELGVKGRIWLDRQCSIIEEQHIARDRGSEFLTKTIGTTRQGVGPAVEDRVKRIARTAGEIPELKPYLADVPLAVNRAIDQDKKVLLEGTQGFYLSLYHGTYPYVTSRDTSASGVCSEVGVSPTKVDDVMLIFKAYMTRVGSGPLPGELTEDEVKKRHWVEIATVTGRMRRAAPFDYNLARRAAVINGATQIVLTKLDVIFPECAGVKRFSELPREVANFIRGIERRVKVPVTLIGTGPTTMDIIDRRGI